MTALERAFGEGPINDHDFGWMVLTGLFYISAEEIACEFDVPVEIVNNWAMGVSVPSVGTQFMVRAFLLEEASVSSVLLTE